MSISDLLELSLNKDNFNSLADYINFSLHYLDFLTGGIQAEIVSQNEPNYRFFQYREDGNFNITRPINANLFYTAQTDSVIKTDFPRILKASKDIQESDESNRAIIRKSIYTIQQTIGATLDALPAGKSNFARKINGDLFERLMRLLIQAVGVDCRTGVIRVPVIVDGVEEFTMNYQHDLLLYRQEDLKVIGSVKTSSKDRLDKILWTSSYTAV